MTPRIGSFDVETGSLDPKTGGLCSIGIISPDNDTFHCFIKPNPALVYLPEAMKVNGLSIQKLIREGITEEAAMGEFAAFFQEKCRGALMVGSNIAFDNAFLKAADERVKAAGAGLYTDDFGQIFRNRTLELSTVAAMGHFQELYSLPLGSNGLPKTGLDNVLIALGKNPRGSAAHDALDDCRLSLACFQEIMDRNHLGMSGSSGNGADPSISRAPTYDR